MPDLNSLLDDESMGGGSVGGHGLVLALHLLRELQSFNTFTSMLTKQYSLLCDGINCLEPFHRTLQNEVRVCVGRLRLCGWVGACVCWKIADVWMGGCMRVSVDVCWCGVCVEGGYKSVCVCVGGVYREVGMDVGWWGECGSV